MARSSTQSKDLRISTAYSSERYAHPFFLPVPAADRQPLKGHRKITEWSKAQLGPIPKVKGKAIIQLEDIIGPDGVAEIRNLGEIRIHALGDSGVGHADEAEKVAEDMATDYKAGAGALNPAFLFHLGDVIYGPNKDEHYGERFYRPYRHYPGKIVAIPGNHDGESKSPSDSPTLKAFLANFCANQAKVPQQASGSGIYRETMMLPGAYWLIEAPFVRFVGLYSNRLENPGYLEGNGGKDTSQIKWLTSTLKEVADSNKKEKKALVIATHHPPYSNSGHAGSTEMSQSIDAACKAAGVVPDAVLSAHAHNYQRYIRRIDGKPVPYIVVGTGGMPPQKVPDANGQPTDDSHETTYEAALASYGYLFLTASARQLKFEFWPLGVERNEPFDPFTIDLTSHVLTRG